MMRNRRLQFSIVGLSLALGAGLAAQQLTVPNQKDSLKFAVIGDTGVHAKCGEGVWQELAAAMTEQFKRGAFVAGLLVAIERAGTLLAAHFPISRDDRNELSNDIEHA